MTHTSEKRWQRNQSPNCGDGLNQQVADLSVQMLDVLYKAEKLGLELEELIDYTGSGKDYSVLQAVADQLFYENWIGRESDPIGNPGVLDTGADKDERRMLSDAVDAINAARAVFEFANNEEKGKSKLSILRRMG